MAVAAFAPGSLITARGRDWVVLPDSDADFVVARPLNGDGEFITGLFPDEVGAASFPRPTALPDDIGDNVAAGLLRTAMRIGFASTAGPFRSLASISVEPRQYQLVPLLLALRMDTVRLLIGDDVGIGKTIEAALIAKELLEQGEAQRLAVLCSPALAEQWQAELRDKFAIDATLVLPSTVTRLQRDIGNDSIFDRYPYTVVSTDFIKSDRRLAQFLRTCPDLVIVDEAHTCVSAGSGPSSPNDSEPRGSARAGGQRQLRYSMLRQVAARADRHLILVTATPHSGKEGAFRDLIGLLDPDLAHVDLETESGRDRLARSFVQRRRRDIRRYLDEETRFPRDRQLREVSYELAPEYAELNRQVLRYARETVSDRADDVRRRVRWWSALALLRSVASSPRAAVATLTARSATAAAETVDEADDLGRSSVLDVVDDAFGDLDAAPGAADDELPRRARDRLRGLARMAGALEGPARDEKLAILIEQVQALLLDGYDPIVFCRFIPTAEYVAQYLGAGLGRKGTVAAVTGTLPPAERIARIGDLTAARGRHVLVATDCLSEGVNLQEHFQAVIHYDLAWNPTRHEQREGRVDRFGQRRHIVRAVTMYGIDNGIDGLVLDVLIRKHATIAKQTGVAVPVPDRSDSLVKALIEGLLLRDEEPDQLAFDIDVTRSRDRLHREWESAAERESKVLTKYAHSGLRELDQVREEATTARDALGRHADVASFVRESLSSLGGAIRSSEDGFSVATQGLPVGVRHALGLMGGHLAENDGAGVRRRGGSDTAPEIVFHNDLPVPPGDHALVRTDPAVAGLARYVLDAALDRNIPARQRPARRCGVIRTTAVATRTTLVLVRYRFHLTLPGRVENRTLVAEDAQALAYRPTPEGREWLDDDQVRVLLSATPENTLPELVVRTAEKAVTELGAQPEPRMPSEAGTVQADLDARGEVLATELLQAHQRVRTAVGALKRGLKVVHNDHADVLGVYVYLPAGGGR